MCSFKSIYFVIFVLNLYKTNAEISDKRLCVDADCNEPASLAKTLLRYSSPDPRILSFAPNQDITIFSKEAGSETNLWGAEIKGKRGYVPKHLVREYKVLNKPKLLVDTELNATPQVPVDVSKENVDPNKAQLPFEVVDGTTIYLGPTDAINPSSTETPLLATAVPPGSSEVVDKTETLDAVSESKEEDSSAKESKEKSVVKNVLSKISNWISDDTQVENSDEEDDEDDDEDEEDEEEEEEEILDGSHERSQENLQDPSIETPEDIRTLHNLPSGVKISTYGLDVAQPLTTNLSLNVEGELTNSSSSEIDEQNTSGEKNQKDASGGVPETNVEGITVTENKIEHTSSEVPVEDAGVSVQDGDEPAESPATEAASPPTGAASPPTEPQKVPFEEPMVPVIHSEHPSETVPPTVEDQQSEYSSQGTPKADQSEVKEEETTNVTADVAATTVTEPTVLEDDLPFVDDVTPNPLDPHITEASVEQTTVDSGSELSQQNAEVIVDSFPSGVDTNGSLGNISENSTENPADQTKPASDGSQSQIVNSDEKSEETEVVPADSFLTNEKVEEQFDKTEVVPADRFFTNENVQDQFDNLTKDQTNQSRTELQHEEDVEGGSLQMEYSTEGPSTSISENEELTGDATDTFNESKEDTPENVDNVNAEQNVVEQQPDIELPGEGIKHSDNSEVEQPAEEHETHDELIRESSEHRSHGEDSEETIDGAKESNSIFSSLFSVFSGESDILNSFGSSSVDSTSDNKEAVIDYCDATKEMCNVSDQKQFASEKSLLEDVLNFNSDIFLYLITTSVSVIIFLLGYIALDRNRKEAPLVARISKLEKQLLITLKENELLQERGSSLIVESVPNDVMEELTQRLAEAQLTNQALEVKIAELEKDLEAKQALEEHIESLEKELETSTEVGLELNRIISEMLDPTNGSDRLKENVEQLQRQLLEQKDTINTISVALSEKKSENKVLQVELEKTKKKAGDLQTKLDEVVDQILKIEKEKDEQHNALQNEIGIYRKKCNEAVGKEEFLNNEIQISRLRLAEAQRQSEIKQKEYQMLQESLNKIKSLKNDSNSLRSLLDVTSAKAELQQLQVDNQKYAEQLQQEQSLKVAYEKKYQAVLEEVNTLQQKYEHADKEKVEATSKLEVLNNYFKKREAELQEELLRYKSIWDTKEGEATSTTERIKHMQQEVENYKAQNETLKQEIISQEVGLKSQISMLEKKVHENWVVARQTERKLEDARQEAAQLRNRLTLRERTQNRLQSPVEQNGDHHPLSPHPIDSPASPPLLYGGRDHITKSPPLPGLPPFLPPPPGAPFMPPPMHGMPPFMPPLPSMFPGDHRPPPLGRMSSPPLNSRYSPETSGFSPYDRHSASPPYDSEYGPSPPPMRGYSPYNNRDNRDDRRDYKRPSHIRSNNRMKGSVVSSGSDHSNDSIDKVNRKQSKIV